MLTRPAFRFGLLSLMLTVFLFSQAGAHHGWAWTDPENSELTGVITSVRLGNPHGRLIVKVNDQEWLVEIGQPWRNARGGLTDERLSEGTKITVIGQRSADHREKRLKAERVVIGGKEYVLYPDRD